MPKIFGSRFILAAFAATLAAGVASAQYRQMPDIGPRDDYSNERDERWPWPSELFNPQEQRNIAGQFDYYSLVLSWSPTYCSDAGEEDAQQCARRDGRRYTFILHGLWPQYECGWPQNCRLPRRPFVPQPVIDGMLDIMPSQKLVIHEYRKHGTCSGLNPEAYFSASRALLSTIRIPKAFVNPFETQFYAPAEIIGLFIDVNPNLRRSMIAVSCGGAGNRLREVRICFTRDGKPRDCGGNENQRKMCSADRVLVPPARSTAREGDSPAAAPGANRTQPLPRPRVIESLRGS